MEKSIIGIDTLVSIKGWTIIPVWEIILSYSFAAGIYLYGNKRAIAAVIMSPAIKKAFRMTGEEVTLEQLIQEIPALKEALEKAKK
jgi:hypothetical protein